MSSFLRYALGFNGVAMVAWSPVLFLYHHMIITSMEGRKVAATKTKFDVMIWRITSLWVAFTGFTCLFLIDMPSGCKFDHSEGTYHILNVPGYLLTHFNSCPELFFLLTFFSFFFKFGANDGALNQIH